MLVRLLPPLLALALGWLGATAVHGPAPAEPPAALRSLAVREVEPRPEDEEAWRAAAGPLVAREAAARARGDATWGSADPRGPYGEGQVERAWDLAPQPGFPGGRIVDGRFDHRAPCEAARVDLTVMTFAAAGGRTAAVLRRGGVAARGVHLLRADGHEALVLVQGRAWRGGDEVVELLAWDLARGRVAEVADARGEDAGWSLDLGPEPALRLRGAARIHDVCATAELAERAGLRLVID